MRNYHPNKQRAISDHDTRAINILHTTSSKSSENTPTWPGPQAAGATVAHPFPFIEWGYRTTLSPGKLFHFPPKPDSLGSEVLRANALPAKISRQGFPFLDNNVAQQRGITTLPFRKAKNASHSSGSLRRTERTANTRTCQPLYPSWLGRFYF